MASAVDLCGVPGAAPPSGTTPYFNTPYTLAPVVYSVCTILGFFAVCFSAGRFFANRRKLQWGDYLMFAGLFLSLTHTGLTFAQTKYFSHQWEIRACWYDNTYFKLLFAQTIILNVALFCTKTSIFLLFYQIFKVQDPMRTAIVAGIISCGLIYLAGIPIGAIFQGPHGSKTRTSFITSDGIDKTSIWGIVQAALSICLDLYMFVLPMPCVLRMNLTRREKIQVLAVFTTGLVAMVASISILVYTIKDSSMNESSWKSSALSLCAIIEYYIAIIVGNVPGMFVFFRAYVSHLTFVRSLRSLWGRSGSSKSLDDRKDPNKPRTKGSGRRQGQDLNLFTDSDIRTNASIGMTRTIDLEQTTVSSLEAQTENSHAVQHPRESGVYLPGRHAGKTSVPALFTAHEMQQK